LLQESEQRSVAKDLIALRQIDDLASKVEELKKTEMEQLQAHKLAQNVITDLKMQISQLQASKSWRLTAPLRAFKKILIK
jgi:hypothetical protein